MRVYACKNNIKKFNGPLFHSKLALVSRSFKSTTVTFRILIQSRSPLVSRILSSCSCTFCKIKRERDKIATVWRSESARCDFEQPLETRLIDSAVRMYRSRETVRILRRSNRETVRISRSSEINRSAANDAKARDDIDRISFVCAVVSRAPIQFSLLFRLFAGLHARDLHKVQDDKANNTARG